MVIDIQYFLHLQYWDSSFQAVGILQQGESRLNDTDDLALDAYFSLARFSDSQYQSIIDYMKSSNYEAKQQLINCAKRDATRLKELGDSSWWVLEQHVLNEKKKCFIICHRFK